MMTIRIWQVRSSQRPPLVSTRSTFASIMMQHNCLLIFVYLLRIIYIIISRYECFKPWTPILFEEHPKGQSPEATAFTSASCELTVSDANPKGCWTEGRCSYYNNYNIKIIHKRKIKGSVS